MLPSTRPCTSASTPARCDTTSVMPPFVVRNSFRPATFPSSTQRPRTPGRGRLVSVRAAKSVKIRWRTGGPGKSRSLPGAVSSEAPVQPRSLTQAQATPLQLLSARQTYPQGDPHPVDSRTQRMTDHQSSACTQSAPRSPARMRPRLMGRVVITMTHNLLHGLLNLITRDCHIVTRPVLGDRFLKSFRRLPPPTPLRVVLLTTEPSQLGPLLLGGTLQFDQVVGQVGHVQDRKTASPTTLEPPPQVSRP